MTPAAVAEKLSSYSTYNGLSPAVQEAFCRGVIRIIEQLAEDEERKQFHDQAQRMDDRDTLLAVLPRVLDVLPAPDPDGRLRGLTGLKGLRSIFSYLMDGLADYHGGEGFSAMYELRAFSVTARRLLEVLPRIEREPDPYAIGRRWLEVCLICDLFEELRIPLDYELAARVTACTGKELEPRSFCQRLWRGNRREYRHATVSSKEKRKV